MFDVKLKAEAFSVYTISDSSVWNNSFVCDGKYSHKDMQYMFKNWINIEDDVDAIGTIVYEKIDTIEEK